MKPTVLTLADIQKEIAELRRDLADAIRELKMRPEVAYSKAGEQIAISAAEVARILGVNRKTVYEMHHANELNGFRPRPNSRLRFLLSEVREVAESMRLQRRNT